MISEDLSSNPMAGVEVKIGDIIEIYLGPQKSFIPTPFQRALVVNIDNTRKFYRKKAVLLSFFGSQTPTTLWVELNHYKIRILSE